MYGSVWFQLVRLVTGGERGGGGGNEVGEDYRPTGDWRATSNSGGTGTGTCPEVLSQSWPGHLPQLQPLKEKIIEKYKEKC